MWLVHQGQLWKNYKQKIPRNEENCEILLGWGRPHSELVRVSSGFGLWQEAARQGCGMRERKMCLRFSSLFSAISWDSDATSLSGFKLLVHTTMWMYLVPLNYMLNTVKIVCFQDFSGGLVVKNPPSNAGDMGSIPGPGTKSLHTMGQPSPSTTTKAWHSQINSGSQ